MLLLDLPYVYIPIDLHQLEQTGQQTGPYLPTQYRYVQLDKTPLFGLRRTKETQSYKATMARHLFLLYLKFERTDNTHHGTFTSTSIVLSRMHAYIDIIDPPAGGGPEHIYVYVNKQSSTNHGKIWWKEEGVRCSVAYDVRTYLASSAC